MKKLFLFLIFITLNGITFGQQIWVPPGAEWHYGFVRANPALNFGYIKIISVGDTVILGKSCKILDQIQIRYNTWYPTPGFDTLSLGKVYTYADSTKVYTYKNNKFYTLYDFGATVGTIWTVCWYNLVFPNDTGQVKVDAIDYSVINGETLKTLYVSRVPGSCIGWTSAVILERLGCINEFMFPDYDESCVSDIQINGNFRCYKDDSFPMYSVTNSDTICEYVLTDIGAKIQNEGNINISPNPASEYLLIESSVPQWNNSIISIYTIDGQKIKEIIQQNEMKTRIDVSSYKPGLYILNIIGKDGCNMNKKIIIN